MKKLLLAVGAALILALGGIGVANLAAGADHSGSGRHHDPEPSQVPAHHGQPSDHGKPAKPDQTGTQHSNQMRDFARAHRDGMRAWQTCHQAGGTGCQKPAPPGWLKHPEKHPGGWPPQGDGNEKKTNADEKGGD